MTNRVNTRFKPNAGLACSCLSEFPHDALEVEKANDDQKPYLVDALGIAGDWWWGDNNNCKGVILTGAAGLGKTTLATLIVKTMARHGVVPAYIPVRQTEARMDAGYDDPKRLLPRHLLEVLDDRHVAVLDDVGTERLRRTTELISTFIEEANRKDRFVILTTNLSWELLTGHLGSERDSSRLTQYRNLVFKDLEHLRKASA